MSDNNFKDYDLSIFEDHDNDKKKENDNNIRSHSGSDYGDDFYTSSESFEAQDETQVFDPIREQEVYKNPKQDNEDSQLKQKNIIIIALSISLALVIFIFSLIFFLGSDDKSETDKKRPTTQTTASETVQPTEETEVPTDEPTDPMTEAPTEAQPPTDPATEAMTEPPTAPPTEPPTQQVETEGEFVETAATEPVIE